MQIHRWALIVLVTWVAPSAAQFPAAPPLPKRYKVELRYDITAPRDVHVPQYDKLIDFLEKAGFDFEPKRETFPDTDREDPGKNLLTGYLPSDSLLRVFGNEHVASILVVPEGMDLPEDASAPVRVRLELAGGLPLARQRELAEQVRGLLFHMGFRETLGEDRPLVGYDHRGHSKQPFTRLMGTIPRGQLSLLRRDLRSYPFGWFAAPVALEDLPTPLRSRHPILITEVMPSVEVRKFEDDKAWLPPEGFEKIDGDLWKSHGEKIIKGDSDEGTLRVEVFLAGSPSPGKQPSVKPILDAAPNFFVLIQVGHVVTGFIDVPEIAALARVPEVTLIRTPRPPQAPVQNGVAIVDKRDDVLTVTNLAKLHADGKRGKGVRLAIVDKDFRAWKAMVDAGKLPAKTRLVDLTWQEDPDFGFAPEPGVPEVPGHGTQCAMVAAVAAPDVEMLLIRVPGNSLHELIELNRFLTGDLNTTVLSALQNLLVTQEKELLHERSVVLKERKEILEMFRDDADEKREFGYLGPVYGWLFNDRVWHFDRLNYQEMLERDLQARFARYRKLVAEIASLKGTQLVVCTLNWPTGFALGGSSPFARWFEERGTRGPIWVQAAGNTRGQAWSGKFRDDDGNGVMEFADGKTKLKPGRWTHELAFLKWEGWEGLEAVESAPVRFTLQWREAHDTDYFLNPGAARKEDLDPYARPQARIDVLLLKQLDPDGKTVGADVFELVARNAATPVRLEYQPGTAVYETSFRATLELNSVYAVRVVSQLSPRWSLVELEEGKPVYVTIQRENTRGTRPPGAPTLPELEKKFELEPRIFIETLETGALAGRFVFADVPTDQGTLGLPAEARSIWSVGAVSADKKSRRYSAEGPPAFAGLSAAPALYAPDELPLTERDHAIAYGTSLSASVAAGWIAAASTGVFERERVLSWLRLWRGRIVGSKTGE